MVIHQGDIYWVDLDEPIGSEPGYEHPYVVIQNNAFNQSRINTIVVCELTSNLNRGKVGANVLLDPGEATLPKQSVVLVSQIATLNKSQLRDYIGTLSPGRVRQILRGVDYVLQPREASD